MSKSLLIAVDFDSTIVGYDFPKIGKPVPNALETLRKLIKAGHKIVLWTVRDGVYLDDAVQYLELNKITLFGINDNNGIWNTSRKMFADIYVDDSAIGCPLAFNKEISNNPFVDWKEVDKLFEQSGVYNGRFNKIEIVKM